MIGQTLAECIHMCGMHGQDLANCILTMLGIK
ncbi:hypothetical protein bsdtw1_00793 [Clostridium fungisolvens]|uniref:Uncharacterized protein n=1 Tax=Clostridium fungisolvens TaxID=1604897 RepID=A0A6V8SHY6_9CLOT|nr:hypothetical protein bsdtw1_00793 [Clostridium fungisolvens]